MPSNLIRTACIAAACISSVAGQAIYLNNVSNPLSSYFTRPQSMAPAVNVSISQDGQADGLIFLGPYGAQYTASGPRIYDKMGNLIWDGFGAIPANAHNVHVCQYQGSPHMCLAQCMDPIGYGVCQALILDSNYRVVQTIQTGRSAMPVDQHEFQLMDDGKTAIVSFYQTVPHDMSYFNYTGGMPYVMQSGFQEIDVASGDVLFEWYSLNHVDISESHILPNSSDVSGFGTSGTSGFDYFHLNSVSKSPSGNFLVSARHTHTIYYINATDQNIIWKMSSQGASTFPIEQGSASFNFSFQHDARVISENATTMVISFFDNASNGYNHDLDTSLASSGKIVAIDYGKGLGTASARLLSVTYPPLSTISASQGNTQVLENGNIFHGWGDVPAFSEHAPDGTVVLAGEFSQPGGGMFSYRAFSFDNWTSTPSNTVPSVYTYALNETSPTNIYASWNGATTVSTWRYYGSQNIGDAFDVVGNTTKGGFETLWVAPSFYRWIMVEAVAQNGTSLRNSSYQATLTPSEAMLPSCRESGCAVLPTTGVYLAPNGSVYRGTD
ncbi:hypothetical protein AC579_3853 [Pseudocercospora musae]|uniref:ASST-domain-containing protein n=1 Tax=Pseudocercospora musae TaxID=113226 RepID=A0A139IRS5_9PEZI|nr:hypothetical protein AC579_3853 [Pseudocercospora musae]